MKNLQIRYTFDTFDEIHIQIKYTFDEKHKFIFATHVGKGHSASGENVPIPKSDPRYLPSYLDMSFIHYFPIDEKVE